MTLITQMISSHAAVTPQRHLDFESHGILERNARQQATASAGRERGRPMWRGFAAGLPERCRRGDPTCVIGVICGSSPLDAIAA
jgi:hypothetical protein